MRIGVDIPGAEIVAGGRVVEFSVWTRGWMEEQEDRGGVEHHLLLLLLGSAFLEPILASSAVHWRTLTMFSQHTL